MALRFYILPLETYQGPANQYRGPKYFHWRFSQQCEPVTALPELANVVWQHWHYGKNDMTILAAVILTQEQHDAISAQSDVISVPENIDDTITSQELQQLQVFCQSNQLPFFAQAGETYRQILKLYVGTFMFTQRFGGITKNKYTDAGWTMQTKWKNMDTEQQQKILDTANSWSNPPLNSDFLSDGELKFEEILYQYSLQLQTKTISILGFVL